MTAADVGAIRCGLHSGFPKCCIRFFIGEWDRKSLAERHAYLLTTGTAGYVPCPACVSTGSFVKVLPCPIGSHGGNVIGESITRYERQGDVHVLVEAEFFYRDKPGSFKYPVVDGQVFHHDDESTS